MKPIADHLALISADAAAYADALASYCADVILLPPCSSADRRIAAHPDTLTALIGDSLILSAAYAAECPSVTEVLRRRAAVKLIFSDTPVGRTYPADIAYNICVHRQNLYGLLPYLAPAVLQEAQRQGYALRSVKQGYAGCAALSCGNTLITADPAIARAAAADGADVLSADGERVSLAGYNCGFIGGAGGVCGNTVFFFGTPSAALHGEMDARGISVISLDASSLADFGGIRFVRLRV